MNLFKISCALALIIPSFLLAENEQRVAVGSRPISEKAKNEIESRKEASEEDAETEEAGYIFDRYPPIYYSNSHHWLRSITVLDSNNYTLELEDGSIWKINSYDGTKALNWLENDPLTITQNNRWFSRHDFRIINKANGTTVEASLHLGPIINGENSLLIIAIDYDQGEILLSDNTAWKLSYLDRNIYEGWLLEDYVIIGTNSNTSIWDSGSDVILINANLKTVCRAKTF